MTDSKYSVTEMQAVDFALGKVIADCFKALDPGSGSRALQRFLARPVGEKIFLVKNDDVQKTLHKLAHLNDEPGRKSDLPAVAYYRGQGFAADPNQHIQISEVARFIGEGTVIDVDPAMRVTLVPLTLTYSMLFLAWDRATLESMTLAWRAAPRSVQHPAAELLGNRGTGEHGQEVTAAKGENKALYRERRFGVVDDFNYLRHIRGKFVGMGAVDFGCLVFPLESESFGKLDSSNPKAVLMVDGGKGDFFEG